REEEKRLVLACVVGARNVDRSANGVTEIVVPQRRSRHSLLAGARVSCSYDDIRSLGGWIGGKPTGKVVEIRIGIEPVVAEKLVEVAVEITPARLGDNVHMPACVASIFGAVVISQNLELRDRVDARVIQ